jgi:hypothetical protein
MQLICAAWIESVNTDDKWGGGTYRSCRRRESLSLPDLLSTGRLLLRVLFITSLKPILCTALTTQNATENKCITSTRTKRDCVPVQCICNRNTSVTGHKGQSAFRTANHCQGQLQTPQSLCVHVIASCPHTHADYSFVAKYTCALCFAMFLYAYDANRSRNGVVNRLDDPRLESRTVQNIQIDSDAHQPPI